MSLCGYLQFPVVKFPAGRVIVAEIALHQDAGRLQAGTQLVALVNQTLTVVGAHLRRNATRHNHSLNETQRIRISNSGIFSDLCQPSCPLHTVMLPVISWLEVWLRGDTTTATKYFYNNNNNYYYYSTTTTTTNNNNNFYVTIWL